MAAPYPVRGAITSADRDVTVLSQALTRGLPGHLITVHTPETFIGMFATAKCER
jgi:hypothetical protein